MHVLKKRPWSVSCVSRDEMKYIKGIHREEVFHLISSFFHNSLLLSPSLTYICFPDLFFLTQSLSLSFCSFSSRLVFYYIDPSFCFVFPICSNTWTCTPLHLLGTWLILFYFFSSPSSTLLFRPVFNNTVRSFLFLKLQDLFWVLSRRISSVPPGDKSNFWNHCFSYDMLMKL